jgi:pimeloyl-ACP methyl ester carboxylesterase
MPPRRRILPSTARPASLAAATSAGAGYGRSDRPDWRSVAWRSHLRAITVAGRRVHLVDIGSGAGTPVLFVHGLGGRWQNWIETMPRVAAERRAVALDLPGFGRSQMPLEPISIEGYAAVIERTCDALELESVVLVGSSMGGAVAARAALLFPALVARLVLVSAAAISDGELHAAPAAALMAAIARTPLGTPEGVRSVLARGRPRHLAFAALVRHPTLIATDTLCELVGGRGSPGLHAAFEALLRSGLRGELPQLRQPALIVQGRDDMLVPVADAVRLSELIGGAQLEILDDTGHLPMIERPVRFNELVLDFAAGSGS